MLTSHDKVMECKPTALQKKREHRNTIGLDHYQAQIRRKDIVDVIEGPHAGRNGEIKHLYRNLVFLHSRMYTENGGIFVCKTKHVKLTGGNKNQSNGVSGLNSLGFMSPRIQSPMHPSGGQRGRGGGRGGRGGSRISRDREILGKSIKITGGPYKGAVGIVKDATDSTARVELHSSCQTISVDRTHISYVGEPVKAGTLSTISHTPSHTPGYGSATPTYIGSKTPLHGSATPTYNMDGSRTPYASMTPSHDGLSTPRGAWDPSTTPARKDDYDYNDHSPMPGTPGYISTSSYPPRTPGNICSDYNYTHSPSPYNQSYATSSPTIGWSPGPTGAPPSPSTPQTPGSGLDPQMGNDWCTPDLNVKIISSRNDQKLINQVGVIKNVNNNNCAIYLLKEDRYVTIPSNCLEPIQPKVGDQFKVIAGEFKESTGVVISILPNGIECLTRSSGMETTHYLKDLCNLKSINSEKRNSP